MAWLSGLFSGASAIPALATVVIIIVLALFAVKKGWVSFKGKGVTIGNDTERTIIRNQMQYMNAILNGTVADIPVRLREGFHYYRTKYIIAEVKDIVEESIIYNHIEDNGVYIPIKQDIIYSKILDLTEDDFFKSPEFKNYLYDLIDKLYKQMIKVRQQYENK